MSITAFLIFVYICYITPTRDFFLIKLFKRIFAVIKWICTRNPIYLMLIGLVIGIALSSFACWRYGGERASFGFFGYPVLIFSGWTLLAYIFSNDKASFNRAFLRPFIQNFEWTLIIGIVVCLFMAFIVDTPTWLLISIGLFFIALASFKFWIVFTEAGQDFIRNIYYNIDEKHEYITDSLMGQKDFTPFTSALIGAATGVIVCIVLSVVLDLFPSANSQNCTQQLVNTVVPQPVSDKKDVEGIIEVEEAVEDIVEVEEAVEDTVEVEESVEELTASNFSFDNTLYGNFGGFQGSMTVSNGSGNVSLEGAGSRSLEVKSIEGNQLVINAYLKGKYIGYYSGTFSYDGGEHYTGIFHNVVSGGAVDFNLHE